MKSRSTASSLALALLFALPFTGVSAAVAEPEPPGASTVNAEIASESSDLGLAIGEADTANDAQDEVLATSSAIGTLEGYLACSPQPALLSPPNSHECPVGETLLVSAQLRPSNSEASLSYQWVADDVELPGETSRELVMIDDLIGKSVTARITASVPGETPVTASPDAFTVVGQTVALSASIPTQSQLPVAVGQTLRVAVGVLQPADSDITYQWLADGTPIPGATQPEFAITAEQIGKTLGVAVTGSRDGYLPRTVTARLLSTAVAADDIPILGYASVEGTPAVGFTLSAKVGDLSPHDATVSYQWQTDGVDLAGATTQTLTLSEANIGQEISVVVTASKQGYRTTSFEGRYLSTVMAEPALNCWVSTVGLPVVGHGLTADPSCSYDAPDGITFGYTWRSLTLDVLGTEPTLTLSEQMIGHQISVEIVANKAGFVSDTATSDTVTVEAAGNPIPDPKLRSCIKDRLGILEDPTSQSGPVGPPVLG